jgi:DNA-binding NarL/FixJ family response regulator
MIFDDQKIEGLIAQCRFREASAALALEDADRSLRGAVYAIAGDCDCSLASVVDPALLACRTAAEVAAYYAASSAQPSAYDHFVAAVVLAWSEDAEGTYASLRAAHDRAAAQRRFDLAVAARERLSHHALFFGSVDLARKSLDEAISLAETHGLRSWLLRSLCAAARLALDAGDLAAAKAFLLRGRALATSPDELAIFAASGAQLAVELGDDSALSEWTSPEILETALHSERPEVAISATIAAVIGEPGAASPAPNSRVATALRRALLQTGSAANAPELFSIGARYAELEDARRAVAALAAASAPSRPYLHAHQLLARAYAFLRSGERLGSIDSAGDAARTFSAMGLRRWTNEAMRMLVSQEQGAERRPRGRSSGSALTEREEQVAQLIRRGARNREVAKALQISEHTVERHVSSILGRLGLRSRWQIAEPRREDEA